MSQDSSFSLLYYHCDIRDSGPHLSMPGKVLWAPKDILVFWLSLGGGISSAPGAVVLVQCTAAGSPRILYQNLLSISGQRSSSVATL